MKQPTQTKKSKLLAYLITPVVFAFVIYLIILSIAFGAVGNLPSYVGLMFSKTAPNFNDRVDNIDFTPAQDTGATTINIADIKFPKPGTAFGKIDIPSTDISCKLFYGDDDKTLDKGAGQYIGSYIPGYGRTTLIAGHNTNYFKTLKKIKVGDEVTITTTYGVYRYKADEIKVYDKSNLAAFDLTKKSETLILYTCHRRNTSIGRVVDRMYVYCKLISGPVILHD